MSKLRKTVLCLAACVTLLSSPCAAEDDDDQIDDAWEDVVRDPRPMPTNKHLAALAFQAAASKVCDGFRLDGDEFAGQFADVSSMPIEGIGDEKASA